MTGLSREVVLGQPQGLSPAYASTSTVLAEARHSSRYGLVSSRAHGDAGTHYQKTGQNSELPIIILNDRLRRTFVGEFVLRLVQRSGDSLICKVTSLGRVSKSRVQNCERGRLGGLSGVLSAGVLRKAGQICTLITTTRRDGCGTGFAETAMSGSGVSVMTRTCFARRLIISNGTGR